MIKLLAWILWLFLLLVICIMQSKRILLTPQLCIVAGFIPQALFAIYYVDIWGIDFCAKTMVTIYGGLTLYVIVSIFVGQIISSKYRTHNRWIKGELQGTEKTIKIERWKLELLLVIQGATLALVLHFYSANIPGSSLLNKIANYAYLLKFASVEDQVHLPLWLSGMRNICASFSFLTSYILLHSIIYKYSQHKVLLVLCLLMGVMTMISSGGRMELVGFIISLVVQFYFILGRKNNWRARLRIRTVIKVLFLGVLVLLTFQWSLVLTGRASNRNFVDYLSNYIASPIMNLDLYIRENKFGSEFLKWDTLRPLINQFGRLLGKEDWIHTVAFRFWYAKGFHLGNVSTMFFSFLHDGGIPAVMIFVTIQAALSQVIFQKAANKQPNSPINISIIFYSYIFYLTFLGFFSERFYSAVFSLNMLAMLLSWILLSMFFERVRLTHNK